MANEYLMRNLESIGMEDVDISIQEHSTGRIPSSFSRPSGNTQVSIEKEWIRDAYKVITQNEWWEEFKHELETQGVDETTGFMFT